MLRTHVDDLELVLDHLGCFDVVVLDGNTLLSSERWFLVAWEQLPLEPGRPAPELRARTKPPKLAREGDVASISGKGFELRFDESSGRLTGWNVDGVELLDADGGPQPNYWRPPNDNDVGNEMHERCAVWRDAGAKAELASFEAMGKVSAVSSPRLHAAHGILYHPVQ